MGILLWIWSDGLLYVLSAIYIVAAVVGSLLSFLWVSARKDEKIQDSEKKYNTLIDGILTDTITDSYSFDVVYKSIKTNNFDLFIRDFLRYALEKKRSEDYRKIENFVKRMEDEKSLKNPFEGCLPSDKQYLLSIKEVVADSNNEAAKNALRELSRTIKEKDRQLHEQKIINIVTIVLTIIGLALNITLGLRGLSTNDVNRIKDATEEVLKSNKD